MWHAQERFNSYSKPLARVQLCLFNSLQFFCAFFVKLKWKNTLNFTMQLCSKASNSVLGKIQGLFKTV